MDAAAWVCSGQWGDNLMRAIATGFFVTAIGYGLLGIVLGLDMAIRPDHAQMPTHAHLMVIRWLSFHVFAFFYFQMGDSAPRWLARVHFWLAQLSLAVLVVALWLIYAGRTQFDPLAGIGATGYAVSFLVFAVVALKTLSRRAPA